MTAQEQQMLQGLVDRINHTQLAEKDPDAEQFIQQSLGPNPDSLYILAQTVLVQGYALEQAQKQLADLRIQLDQARQAPPEPRHATSFLGSLLGHHDEPQRQAPPPPPPPPPQMPMQTQYGGTPMYAPSGGYPLPGQPQGGGFLRSAMQTATGVAAGALAFEGIESLMHGFGHEAGYGSGFGGGGFEGGGRPEEVINNYYGDSAPHEHGDAGSGRDDRSSGFYDPSSDASRSDGADSGKGQDAADSGNNSADTNADDLSGTAGTDYSSDGDDSMLSDDVGDGDQGGDDLSGDDSGGDFDSGGDNSGGGDDGF